MSNPYHRENPDAHGHVDFDDLEKAWDEGAAAERAAVVTTIAELIGDEDDAEKRKLLMQLKDHFEVGEHVKW